MFARHGKKWWMFGFLTFLALLSATPAFPQSIWIDRGVDRAIWLEGLKTSFDGDDNFTFLTSAWYLSGRFGVGRGPLKVVLLAEIPFAHGGTKDYYDPFFDTTFPGESKNTFGNPYFGVELGGANSPFSGEFGIRPPLVDENGDLAWAAAFFTDYDRFEAFVPNNFIINGKANFRHRNPSGLVTQVRLGPILFIPTESSGDAELFGDYSAQLGYAGNNAMVLVGLTGRAIITEGDLSFNERTIHQLGTSASYAFGHFIPGLHFRFPMDDDLDDIVNFVFGINLGYRLP